MESVTHERKTFDGHIRPLIKEDIPALRKISQFWLRDGSVIAYSEVGEDMEGLKNSLKEGSNTKMFVAQNQEGQIIGMMGLALHPKLGLLPFVQTNDPCEL